MQELNQLAGDRERVRKVGDSLLVMRENMLKVEFKNVELEQKISELMAQDESAETTIRELKEQIN